MKFNDPISELEPAIPFTVELGSTLAAVVVLMREQRVGALLVVEKDSLCGIITERDLILGVLGNDIDLNQCKVEEHMTSDPESLGADDTIGFALNRMSLGGYRHVPLVDASNHPVGIISVKDIMRWVVETFPDEVMNLPPEPSVHGKAREGA